MPRKPRWYDPLPEATATVDCGGEKHRVTWRRGKVVLEDHDLNAEKGMMAFGGEMCECMRVLAMWVEQFRMSPEQFLGLRKWLGPHADLAGHLPDLGGEQHVPHEVDDVSHGHAVGEAAVRAAVAELAR